jgi:sugar phosphate isomerase/epimerase
MRIGIRAHDLGKDTIDHLFSKAQQMNFHHLQLVFKKGLVDENNQPLVFNQENALLVKEKLDQYPLDIAMLGAYFNPVHSNKALVQKNIAYFVEHLQYAHLLSCQYVGTETGSYNDDKWTYNPKNQTTEGYLETMQVFHYLVNQAQKYHTTLLMEPAYGHVIYSVDVLKKAILELNSPYVAVTIDLFNLLYIGNYLYYKEMFIHALNTFKDLIKIIHLKDFYVEGDHLVQCGLGKGIIDFQFICEQVKNYCPNATLIFEGVVGEDIVPSYALINKIVSSL